MWKYKNANFKTGALIAVFLFFCFFTPAVKAETNDNEVNYDNGIIIDSDLDGLTDQAEIQKYQTDPNVSDTDGDGIIDGTEVIQGTNPSDANDPGIVVGDSVINLLKNETPWAWYLARAAGIVGFVFLWLTIFLGLAIRNPILKKFIEPVYSFDFHCFAAASAVFWALVHGTSLLADKMIGFSVSDVAIPYFHNSTVVNTNYLALGIMAFYALVVITITSYMRNHMSHWLWRALHFLSPIAFVFVVLHGYNNGTDMKNIYIAIAYLTASAFLVWVHLSSLVFVIINKFKQNSAEGDVE